MFTIIIGIIIILGLLFYGFKISKRDAVEWYCLIFSIIIGCFSLIISISGISGYDERTLIEENKLISLSSDDTTSVYVYSSEKENIYTFCCKIPPSKTGSKHPENVTFNRSVDSIELLEDSNCTEAVFQEYRAKAKRSLWTFGIMNKTSFVLHVPKGSVIKN